jgi:hypothetical protein
MDNDCNGATAGSIVGVVVGADGIDEKWYRGFDDTVHSYIIGNPKFGITELVERFTRQAEMSFPG